jgi:hypothetical protein
LETLCIYKEQLSGAGDEERRVDPKRVQFALSSPRVWP